MGNRNKRAKLKTKDIRRIIGLLEEAEFYSESLNTASIDVLEKMKTVRTQLDDYRKKSIWGRLKFWFLEV